MRYLGIILGIVLSFVLVFSAMSLEPPLPGELEKYKKDGSYEARLAFAKSLGNDKFDPALIQRKKAQMEATMRGEMFNTSALPYPTGLPSSGVPKIFALLVEFPDDPDTPGDQSYPHQIEKSVIEDMLFGDGEPANYPRESLANYYDRSSYDDLHISRNESEVYGWYMAQHHRAWYESPGGVNDKTNAGKVIMEALSYYDPTVDFSKYDNDGDGDVDYFCVFWTGPNSGWGTLWWGWCDMRGNMFGPGGPYSYFQVDGKSLRVLSWQWESSSPNVIIHETGHALGLKDYYDYDGSVGPDGGVGGLDMMDGNWGDHNCFSKWLLDWVTPSIINESNPQEVTLHDSARNRDCVAVMPGLTSEPPGMFSEYFMVQNRSRVGNDSTYPTDGLIIWHVDARLDDETGDFAWNNSYTEHKLLRLMEADGLEEIERGFGADAGDFYDGLADVFASFTKPNSKNYADSYTGVIVNNISAGGVTMTADIKIGSGGPVTKVSYDINGGAASTKTREVTLNNAFTGDPEQYMASESPTFKRASWRAYETAPLFTLSAKYDTKTVYFKVRNYAGESATVSDTIFYGKQGAPAGQAFALLQAFPGPGNPSIWIPFTLSEAEHVIIKIYDMAGRLVRTLDLGQKASGAYVSKDKAAYWDGRNESGEKVTSGIYFYLMEAGSFRAMKKMVILK